MHYDHNNALIKTELEGMEPARGKVRDIYDLGDSLLIVATDRISAFDCVMPNGIPKKGQVLTRLSLFWLDFLDNIQNHLKTADVHKFPRELQDKEGIEALQGRSMLVEKTRPVPVECVVRGFLAGSGWKEYQSKGTVCDIPLESGYRLADKLQSPVFTPATKAEHGEHDENIDFQRMASITGHQTAEFLRDTSLNIYQRASEYAEGKGVIIADTKFEFGYGADNSLVLIDEVLTPDSSRFWPAENYEPGNNPPSLDKQFVRDYLEESGFNKEPPAPELPDDVVEKTTNKYKEALRSLSGQEL